MKETIKEKYNNLIDDIYTSYNKILIIDDYDFYESNPYTIFYLSKNESYDKFCDLWKKTLEFCRQKDFCYDDILNEFIKQAKNFDFLELGSIDIYTDSIYTLCI